MHAVVPQRHIFCRRAQNQINLAMFSPFFCSESLGSTNYYFTVTSERKNKSLFYDNTFPKLIHFTPRTINLTTSITTNIYLAHLSERINELISILCPFVARKHLAKQKQQENTSIINNWLFDMSLVCPSFDSVIIGLCRNVLSPHRCLICNWTKSNPTGSRIGKVSVHLH